MKSALLLFTLLLSFSAFAETYNQVRPKIWSKLYPDGGWTLYCNERIPPIGGMIDRKAGYQIEHVYPASWMADHLGCGSRTACRKHETLKDEFNEMESDPHNLWPAMIQYNQMRKNYRFGEVQGERWRFSSCDFELGAGNIIEPSTRARGKIARSMLYMHDTYGLPINEPLMREWHEEHPVTDDELRRDQVIKEEWGKENRWISQ